MADYGIKKSTIKNKNLPYVSFDDNALFYNVRYRIVSEDKNRISHWSPIFRLEVPTTTDAGLPYTSTDRIHVNTVGNSPTTIITTWNYPQESEYNMDPEIAALEKVFSDVKVYDVWIRWNPNNSPDNTNWSDWTFSSTITANSFNILKPDPLPSPLSYTPKQIGISIQIPTLTKTFDTRLSLYTTSHNI